jgi:transposase-like protein
MPLPTLAALADVREGFMALCVSAGREVLSAMMEQDRTALCGAKGVPNPQREAGRGGSAASEVTFGGRRIGMRRLRVRSVKGTEVEVPSFVWAAHRDPLDAHTLGAIAAGVSTRRYRGSLEALPAVEDERAVSKSSVSRRFVALSAEMITKWLSRSLEGLDLCVIMIDGINFDEWCIVIALGIATDGRKHVLGLREGATENTAVAEGLIDDLDERGLATDRALVFVIDGAKALRKAIKKRFGDLALVHRCQVHKRRNVLDHLPKSMHASVRRAMNDAYDGTDAELAKQQLERLARALESDHPGAASSLREGLDETLTLQRLGATGALYRTLRSTNPIENLNGSVVQFTRNVRRWRDGTMVVRWVGTALHEAQKHFRRLQGYRNMPRLVTALRKHEGVVKAAQRKVDTRKKAA